MRAAVHDRNAVDDDVFHPHRKAFRVGSRGGRADGFGVEHRYVRLHAVADDAPIEQAETLGGEGSHLADGVGQRQLALFADILAEYDGEAAVSARAWEVAEKDGVAADHRQRMRHERGQRLGVKPLRDVACLQVFRDEQVAEGVHRALPPHLGDFCDGTPFVNMVFGALEVCQPHIAPSGRSRLHFLAKALARVRVGERRFQAFGPSLVNPIGEHYQNPRAA